MACNSNSSSSHNNKLRFILNLKQITKQILYSPSVIQYTRDQFPNAEMVHRRLSCLQQIHKTYIYARTQKTDINKVFFCSFILSVLVIRTIQYNTIHTYTSYNIDRVCFDASHIVPLKYLPNKYFDNKCLLKYINFINSFYLPRFFDFSKIYIMMWLRKKNVLYSNLYR